MQRLEISSGVVRRALNLRGSARRLDLTRPSTTASALAATCSRVNGGRVADLPVGSPIMPVKSPIRKMTWWPSSWNWRSLVSSTVWPRCRSAAVGSKPALTRNGRPLRKRSARSAREIRSTAPRASSASCDSTGVVMAGSEPAAAAGSPAAKGELLFCWISPAFRWSTPAPRPAAPVLADFLLVFGKIQAHQ